MYPAMGYLGWEGGLACSPGDGIMGWARQCTLLYFHVLLLIDGLQIKGKTEYKLMENFFLWGI